MDRDWAMEENEVFRHETSILGVPEAGEKCARRKKRFEAGSPN